MGASAFRLRALFFAVAIGGSMVAVPASARRSPNSGTTIRVTSTADDNTIDGNCSLREALKAADTDHAVDACAAGHGTDTIVLQTATYAVRRGTLEVQSAVTIAGAGRDRTIIDRGATKCCDTALVALESSDTAT